MRCETAGEHEALERLLDLTAPAISTARHRQVLRAFYGFYEPLEVRLRRAAAEVALLPAPSFELRARAEMLARDLIALGASPAEIARMPRCRDLPTIASAAQLGGCLYVLEGASLGGQLIARVLAHGDDPQLAAATAFFTGDGAQTGPRWKTVIAWLERLVRAGTPGEELVAAARATFDSLARWLQLQGAAR